MCNFKDLNGILGSSLVKISLFTGQCGVDGAQETPILAEEQLVDEEHGYSRPTGAQHCVNAGASDRVAIAHPRERSLRASVEAEETNQQHKSTQHHKLKFAVYSVRPRIRVKFCTDGLLILCK